MYLGKVFVSYRPSVFDPQGDVIKNSLHQMTFENVQAVTQGKYFEIKLDAKDLDQAKQDLIKLTEALLINPNTETYNYDIQKVEV